MADEDEIQEADDAEEGGEDLDDLTEGLESKKFAGKKMVIIGGAALLVIIIAVVAFFMFSGGDEVPVGEDGEPIAEGVDPNAPTDPEIIFFPMDERLINLNTGGRQVVYLKVQISLEVDSQDDFDRLEELSPRIIDTFTVYLRELRVEDLDGSAGMFRLKEELLRRVNLTVAPVVVKDILFNELLVQ